MGREILRLRMLAIENRLSTAVAVLAVVGVAAYVSYWHAYAVVCVHGEAGVTARLEPATIRLDGLRASFPLGRWRAD